MGICPRSSNGASHAHDGPAGCPTNRQKALPSPGMPLSSFGVRPATERRPTPGASVRSPHWALGIAQTGAHRLHSSTLRLAGQMGASAIRGGAIHRSAESYELDRGGPLVRAGTPHALARLARRPILFSQVPGVFASAVSRDRGSRVLASRGEVHAPGRVDQVPLRLAPTRCAETWPILATSLHLAEGGRALTALSSGHYERREASPARSQARQAPSALRGRLPCRDHPRRMQRRPDPANVYPGRTQGRVRPTPRLVATG